MKKITLTLAIAAFALIGQVNAQTYVNGYQRSDGTYVSGHYRSTPDGNPNNNWSTKGNYNPYTGQAGTKTPDYNSGYNSSSSGNRNGYNGINSGYGR
ncbi:MAG: hypothetical protein NT096_00015 [Proteobacteria bacterium]|nr:hypothetical protein [Pseudomonadota bacterium]